MTEMLPGLVICLLLVSVVLLIIALQRRLGRDFSPLQLRFDALEKHHERTERSLRDDIARNRDATSLQAHQARQEIGNTLRAFGASLHTQMTDIANLQKNQLESFSERLEIFTVHNDQQLSAIRQTVEQRLGQLHDDHAQQLEHIRQEARAHAQQQRQETLTWLKNFNDSVLKGIADMAALQKGQLEMFTTQLGTLTDSNDRKLEALRHTVDARLTHIQDNNARQLEQMRATVDEKLQGALEKRLGESFKQVSERLEQVHKGLGEMQALATGVGDLKRVLTNVKTRGVWGEMQLETLLEQILTPEQYKRNVKTNDSSDEMVEFAIKLPGRGDSDAEVVWLPIDAKFPTEDYQRLVDAQEKADAIAADAAAKMLAGRIKQCARDICDKYLNPPRTTDFGIMFLPIEGLYAEVVRRPELLEIVQRECRVIIAGPTTFAALLNSLQMGFRTVAIQQRSSEVWQLLGTVKTEFGKFGSVLDGVKKKLDQASHTMDNAAKRSRAIERKLRRVQELPTPAAPRLLVGNNDTRELDDA